MTTWVGESKRKSRFFWTIDSVGRNILNVQSLSFFQYLDNKKSNRISNSIEELCSNKEKAEEILRLNSWSFQVFSEKLPLTSLLLSLYYVHQCKNNGRDKR